MNETHIEFSIDIKSYPNQTIYELKLGDIDQENDIVFDKH